MKTVLFCNLPYAFSILKPIADELNRLGYEYIWFVPTAIEVSFPYTSMPYTTNIDEINTFKSDAIFVPGNEVPYWLRGLKVQIFHGLAGEKKGHFRIRGYFDLYLTQGPYFTNKFKELALKHKNFDVIETGWCKLDNLYSFEEKENFQKTILYAPTFSPSLTSAKRLFHAIQELGSRYKIIIKFHDKMDIETVNLYKNIQDNNIYVSNQKDITPLLQTSDLMISDTSSVVYEFTLLNKPVVTLNSTSENINWENCSSEETLKKRVLEILGGDDKFKEKREDTILQYHPYNDGKSANRMIVATESYIKKHGVPEKRELSLLRKIKLRNLYKQT